MKNFSCATICVLLSLVIGCKKSDPSPASNHLAELQASLTGNWYYNSLDVRFYMNRNELVLDDVLTPDQLRYEPYFVFNKDFSGSYVNPYSNQQANFSYRLSSSAAGDSLICTGGINQRYRVEFPTGQQMNLTAALSDSLQVQKYGLLVNTDFTTIVAVLQRTPMQ